MGQTFISFFVPPVCYISVISLLNLIFSSGSDKVYMLHWVPVGWFNVTLNQQVWVTAYAILFKIPLQGQEKEYRKLETGSLNPVGSVSILTSLRGRKGHPFVSVLRREWCLPEAQKLMGYVREELWLSFPVYSFLGTWFIIAWLQLGCSLRQRAGAALSWDIWSLKKKVKTSEEWGSAGQSFISYPLSRTGQNTPNCQ